MAAAPERQHAVPRRRRRRTRVRGRQRPPARRHRRPGRPRAAARGGRPRRRGGRGRAADGRAALGDGLRGPRQLADRPVEDVVLRAVAAPSAGDDADRAGGGLATATRGATAAVARQRGRRSSRWSQPAPASHSPISRGGSRQRSANSAGCSGWPPPTSTGCSAGPASPAVARTPSCTSRSPPGSARRNATTARWCWRPIPTGPHGPVAASGRPTAC